MRRPAAIAIALALALAAAACGEEEEPGVRADAREAPRGTIVAALGDSIIAGTPLWDPRPMVRESMPETDERSQIGFWVERRLGEDVAVRNCGVPGERTDEIAFRLEACADGADVLLVQGGVNDLAQGRPPAEAAADLRRMVRRGKALGLRVAVAEVLPWNNGYPQAAPLIDDLNRRIGALARAEDVPVLPFHDAIEDPRRPGRMPERLTEDGDHPTVEGYRRLADVVRLP